MIFTDIALVISAILFIQKAAGSPFIPFHSQEKQIGNVVHRGSSNSDGEGKENQDAAPLHMEENPNLVMLEKRSYLHHKCRFTKYGEPKPVASTILPTTTVSTTTQMPVQTTTTHVVVPQSTTALIHPTTQPPIVNPTPPVNQKPPQYRDRFVEACLKGQNDARAEVGLPPMEWDDQLAKSAEGWSDRLATENTNLYHSNIQVTRQGENLYKKWMSYGRLSDVAICRAAVDAWVAEKALWEQLGRPATGHPRHVEIGHYTQIVWRSTRKVGCAVTSNDKQNQYVTCISATPFAYRFQQTFIDACLSGQNAARAEVGLLPMVWDETLAANAQEWTNKLARENSNLEHSDVATTREGENLYKLWMSYGTLTSVSLCQAAVGAWVAEKALWEQLGRPVTGHSRHVEIGHYTQIVWNTTTRVGCALATNQYNTFYVTCRYKEIGNIKGCRPF